jgi:hypothetical protein
LLRVLYREGNVSKAVGLDHSLNPTPAFCISR